MQLLVMSSILFPKMSINFLLKFDKHNYSFYNVGVNGKEFTVISMRRIIMTPVKKATKKAVEEVKEVKEEVKETEAKKTTAKKTAKKSAKKAVDTVKEETPKIAEAVKEETKKVEEAVKEETKKAADTVKEETKKVEEAVKKEAKKVEEAVKEETKIATKKVTDTAKKVTAPETNVYVEFFGRQFAMKAVVEQALKAYKDSHKNAAVKTFEVYVKPEENVAYYVVNGEGSDDFKVQL